MRAFAGSTLTTRTHRCAAAAADDASRLLLTLMTKMCCICCLWGRRDGFIHRRAKQCSSPVFSSMLLPSASAHLFTIQCFPREHISAVRIHMECIGWLLPILGEQLQTNFVHHHLFSSSNLHFAHQCACNVQHRQSLSLNPIQSSQFPFIPLPMTAVSLTFHHSTTFVHFGRIAIVRRHSSHSSSCTLMCIIAAFANRPSSLSSAAASVRGCVTIFNGIVSGKDRVCAAMSNKFGSGEKYSAPFSSSNANNRCC